MMMKDKDCCIEIRLQKGLKDRFSFLLETAGIQDIPERQFCLQENQYRKSSNKTTGAAC